MNKHFKKIILISLAYFLFPVASFAQNYVPISPTGVNNVDLKNPDAYFTNLFNVFLAVAVILAVIKLMICGIQYITSEAMGTKAAAKTCIQYVVGGLLLIMTSFIFLQTINKDLVGVGFGSIGEAIKSNLDYGGGGQVPLDVREGGQTQNPPVPIFKHGKTWIAVLTDETLPVGHARRIKTIGPSNTLPECQEAIFQAIEKNLNFTLTTDCM